MTYILCPNFSKHAPLWRLLTTNCVHRSKYRVFYFIIRINLIVEELLSCIDKNYAIYKWIIVSIVTTRKTKRENCEDRGENTFLIKFCHLISYQSTYRYTNPNQIRDSQIQKVLIHTRSYLWHHFILFYFTGISKKIFNKRLPVFEVTRMLIQDTQNEMK